jgi:hypothetical protein
MARLKKRIFFRIEASDRPAAGFEILSKMPVRTPSSPLGVPKFSEPPQLILNRKLGKPLTDMEPFGSFWIVSANLKKVLQQFDVNAAEFAEFKVTHHGDAGAHKYWLCDIVRIIDALDEDASVFSVNIVTGGGQYYALHNSKLSFRPEIEKDVHVFRVQQNSAEIFCDEEFKMACSDAGVKGMSFIRA